MLDSNPSRRWTARLVAALPPVEKFAPWLALPCAAVPLHATAGYGAYLHGYGTQSSGLGGIGYALPQDTTPLSANPALAGELGKRFDAGLEWDLADSQIRISGNAAGQDASYRSSYRNFLTPQAGFTLPLSDRLSIGMTGFFAGMGASYHHSPFARFGGSERSSLNMAQAGISNVAAYSIVPGQVIGLSLNLSYQLMEVKGMDALASMSQAPDHFTDQGMDGAFGVGFTLGWHGQLTPWLSAGAGYRSKSWTQRAQNYAGLLPDGGRLEFPATYGGGIAVKPHTQWTVAADVQRVMYSDEQATGNPIANLSSHPLGADGGPGFGWNNQTIYKFGVLYEVTPCLRLRAGYSHATENIPASETLFGILTPSPLRDHYTAGATAGFGKGWEVSTMLSYGAPYEVKGQNSIPTSAGGGEAILDLRALVAGISFGRRLGN